MGGRRRSRRKSGWRWRHTALTIFFLGTFATGFYLAQVYIEISAMIEQRKAALTSTIYSAPLSLEPGQGFAELHLRDRLDHLAYTRVAFPVHPGEYAEGARALSIFVRDFRLGVRNFPPTLINLAIARGQIAAIRDSSGGELGQAVLEPQVIGRLMPDAPAERVEVRLEELKPYVTGGLLATEDRWFYYHPGFDPIRILEAVLIDLRAGRLQQGASTITQQLARTFLPRRGRSFRRKFREAAVAVVLEIRLTKREILERYVNDVEMGEYHGAPIYGLPLAARYLFNKDLREVTPAEAATLIGMIRAPTLYDPRRRPEQSRARRDTVLALMRRAGLVDAAACSAAIAAPIELTRDAGLRRAPYFTDYVTSLVLKISGLHGHLEGMKVYTTLDSELQSGAEASVVANLERLEREHKRLRRPPGAERLESSMVALDVGSGAIRAMVGGRDYSTSQFNRALMAKRQPGSAFKPIVYLTALDPERCPLDRPLTLATILPDRPMSFGGWTPANYEGTYRGEVTVADALAESLNAPTAYVGSLLGPAMLVRTAHELGIHDDLPAVLPLAIGAGEMTLSELTSAYQVFAAGGVAREPYAIESVVDSRGHLIFQHEPTARRLIRPDVAYLVTAALEGVIRHGTGAGAGAMGLHFPAAGKTGTTDDYHDAYFIGYTPRLVAGVWVGFDTPQSLGLPGAQAALPAWVNLMVKAAPARALDFEQPDGIVTEAIDPETGELATAACPRSVVLPFLAGTEPRQVCSRHGGGLFASRTPLLAPAPVAPPAHAVPGPATFTAQGTGSGGLFGALGNFIGSLFGR